MLPQDFKEFIELMISNRVRFVMIGGYAYNLYRNPRATGDIDFIVDLDPENEKRIRKVLTDFGFGSTLPPEHQKLLEDGKVIMLGRSPLRIDILTRIDGVEFAEVNETSQRVELDGLAVPVISPRTLLKNKRAAGRPKDLPDILELEAWLRTQKG
ncbi:nucleotidyl transferase AbiEii/AbiGii toxin family protein [Pirellulaceae bacterium SH449]